MLPSQNPIMVTHMMININNRHRLNVCIQHKQIYSKKIQTNVMFMQGNLGMPI